MNKFLKIFLFFEIAICFLPFCLFFIFALICLILATIGSFVFEYTTIEAVFYLFSSAILGLSGIVLPSFIIVYMLSGSLKNIPYKIIYFCVFLFFLSYFYFIELRLFEIIISKEIALIVLTLPFLSTAHLLYMLIWHIKKSKI